MLKALRIAAAAEAVSVCLLFLKVLSFVPANGGYLALRNLRKGS